MARNVLDPKQQAELARKQAQQAQQLKADFILLMQRAEFRSFIGAYLEKFNPMGEGVSFNGSENYWLQGQQEAGKWLLDLVLTSCGPDVFAQVLVAWRKKPKEDDEHA